MKHGNAGRSVAAILSASLLAVPAQAADLPATAQPGQRVRIVAAAPGVFQGVATGTLVEVGTDSLTMVQAEGAVLRLPLLSVTRVEVSQGRRRGTRRGLLFGAAVGLAMIPAIMSDEDIPCGEFDNVHPCSREERKGIAAFGVVFSAGVGAIWGYRKQTEQWRDSPLDHLKVSVRPTRGGGRVALTMAF
jgi:hypothetical protein